MLLQRRPLHQPERGGGLSNHSRSGRQSHQGSGCRQATLCEMPHRCRGMDNRDSPSDTLGIRLSDNSRRMPCCERQGEDGNIGFYLCPYFREYGGISGIVGAQSVYLTAPIVVVFWLGLDEGVELVHYLPVAHDDYSDRAHR